MAQKPGRKAKPEPSPDDVRRRAYRIWEEEGRPHGRDAEHWSRAEREIAEAAGPGPERSVPPPKPRKRATPAPTAGKGRKR